MCKALLYGQHRQTSLSVSLHIFPQTQLTMEDIQRFSPTIISLDIKEQSTSPESKLYLYLQSVLIFKASVIAKTVLVYIPYDSQKLTKIFLSQ